MGESISLPFLNSRATHIPWIVASSSIFKSNNSGVGLSHIISLTLLVSPHLFPTLTLLPILFIFKGTYDYHGPTQIIQDSIPILRSVD